MARVVASELEKTKISDDGPRYDAAYLKELKASTPSSRPRMSAVEDPYDADMSLLSSDVPVQTLSMDVGGYLPTRTTSYRCLPFVQMSSAQISPPNRRSKLRKRKEKDCAREKLSPTKTSSLCPFFEEKMPRKGPIQKVG